jgi:hypothetical protein
MDDLMPEIAPLRFDAQALAQDDGAAVVVLATRFLNVFADEHHVAQLGPMNAQGSGTAPVDLAAFGIHLPDRLGHRLQRGGHTVIGCHVSHRLPHVEPGVLLSCPD